ncbi:OmpA/MotB domain protein precursor [Halorhodospira halochloris]|uniref:OmpA/MotB domain protein n=1 Tax=Halorhodospira halochloris TaxID=1052 RepID=A0A110B5B2_HALHR|nr:OmpA family protein [Halorhodospira halochloris]MBK1651229.1 hypothetical protein [Halorhodospira halochloris]BAU57503.1 OmpA/MotB domain protein precursor [Halorhodospira halochloris]
MKELGRTTHLSLIGLIALALLNGKALAQPEPQTQVHRASPHHAQWHTFEGRSGCHLVHEIASVGTALISYRHTDGRQFLSFFARTPPRSQHEGDLYISEPSWGSDRRSHIERLMVHPHQRTLRFSNRTTNRLLDALRQGLEPQFNYPSAHSDQEVKVALTPAAFQNAHRHYIECIDRHERVDAGTASRGAVIPGRTGEAMADSGGGVWEGSLPRLPRGPRADIYFATASDDLTRDAINEIRDFVRDLEDNPHWGVVLSIGYADTRGSPQANEQLARERAQRVRDELVRLGIPERRINIEARLLESDELEEDTYELAKNRRVELRTAL